MTKPNPNARILTINGGSSSIKFALFEPGAKRLRILSGRIEGIGHSIGLFEVKSRDKTEDHSQKIKISNHVKAVNGLMDWIQPRIDSMNIGAVGHRIVHGGPNYWSPERITTQMLRDLKKISAFDPEHLPEELHLTEAFHRRFPRMLQVACFDTAFHHDMPPVAQLVPIPKRYRKKGIRRYGFHGLSCTYLLKELARVAGRKTARGRIIFAHLGSGASVTAVRNGKSVDTSMGFTPVSGLPMSTRSGDLDPGLAGYLARTERMTPARFNRIINHESGLLAISGTSSDMRELRLHSKKDPRAAEAVDFFCYQTKKWIGAFTSALGGLDTLVFAGGIGENAPDIRAQICEGLDFLGVKLDSNKNDSGSPIISTKASRITVRVIRTDEESIIAEMTEKIFKKRGKTKR